MRKTLCKIGTFFTTVLLFWVLFLDARIRHSRHFLTPLHKYDLGNEIGFTIWSAISFHFIALLLIIGAVLAVYYFSLWLLLVLAAVFCLYWFVRLSHECAKKNNSNN